MHCVINVQINVSVETQRNNVLSMEKKKIAGEKFDNCMQNQKL